MRNPLKYLLRLYLRLSLKPLVRHSMRALSQVDFVTVLFDGQDSERERLAAKIQAYFESKSLPLRLYCPGPEQLDYAGRIKPSQRLRPFRPFILPRCPRPEGLFVCLIADPESFLARYETLRSGAVFKIGCCGAHSSDYDLTVTSPDNSPASQEALFDAICDCLNKIKNE